jgi:peptide-methionine (S)-S-oxide reductase
MNLPFRSTWPLPPDEVPDPPTDVAPTPEPQAAVLGGGCFWCTEAVFLPLDGVLDVTSGYAGGAAETANYRAVCTGETGHAEVIRIRFDSNKITFGQLLKVFFTVAHDPTQRNRQGNDWGTQYRSAVFYADEAQRAVAEAYVRALNEPPVFGKPVQTTVEPLDAFYEAEAYHQDYAARNADKPYVVGVALPKVEKLRQHYGDRLKGRAPSSQTPA